jgi:hypothetical protein
MTENADAAASGPSDSEVHPRDLETLLRRQEEWITALEARLAIQERQLAKIADLLTRVRADLGRKGVQGAVARVDKAVSALLRREYLDPLALAPPFDLTAERFGIACQNEEDGLTLAILRRIGAANRRFVDIGCGGNGGNSGLLAQELGWSGLMIDGDDFQSGAARYWFASPAVAVVQAMVTRENVDALLTAHGGTGEIDLLSIDVDGNDYWLWEAMTACSPRLVIVEYNAEFGPDRAVVVPYDPAFDRHQYHQRYYGASLAALAQLAAQKGYRLVAAEPTGINAYFLRNDLGPTIPACAPQRAYRRSYQYFRVPPRTQESIFTLIERMGWPLVDMG